MIIFAGKWDEQQDHLASLDLAIAGNSQPVSSHPFAVTFSISFLFVDDRIHRACRQASYCIHHKAKESYSIYSNNSTDCGEPIQLPRLPPQLYLGVQDLIS